MAAFVGGRWRHFTRRHFSSIGSNSGGNGNGAMWWKSAHDVIFSGQSGMYCTILGGIYGLVVVATSLIESALGSKTRLAVLHKLKEEFKSLKDEKEAMKVAMGMLVENLHLEQQKRYAAVAGLSRIEDVVDTLPAENGALKESLKKQIAKLKELLE